MSQENIELISALYEAFSRQDQAFIFKAADPEITICQTEQLPWGGNYLGIEGLKGFLARLFQHVNSRVKIDEYFAAGDQVVAIGGTIGEVQGSRVKFDVRVVHIWKVRDGKVTRFEPYINTPKMLHALAGSDEGGPVASNITLQPVPDQQVS